MTYEQTDGPSGLGGWLILPFLGLVLSAVVTGIALNNDVVPAFGADIWPALTTPESPVYHPSWAPYLVAAAALNSLIILSCVLLFVLGIAKRKVFPPAMVTFYVLVLVASSLDIWAVEGFLAEVMPDEAASMKPETYRDFFRMVVTNIIWSSYFLVSKRVKNTFVK